MRCASLRDIENALRDDRATTPMSIRFILFRKRERFGWIIQDFNLLQKSRAVDEREKRMPELEVDNEELLRGGRIRGSTYAWWSGDIGGTAGNGGGNLGGGRGRSRRARWGAVGAVAEKKILQRTRLVLNWVQRSIMEILERSRLVLGGFESVAHSIDEADARRRAYEAAFVRRESAQGADLDYGHRLPHAGPAQMIDV